MKSSKIKYKNFSFKNKLILFVLVTFLFSYAYCDLPVHCLSSKLEGVWLLHMSNNNGDNSIKCGHEHPDKNLDHINSNPEVNEIFIEKYQILILLERPNMIYGLNTNSNIENNINPSNNHQIGKWTMVYDEGFELQFGDNVFFAFNKYKQISQFIPSNTDTEDTPGYKSDCDRTFVGWFRNSNNKNWGCFWGEKIINLNQYNLKDLNYTNIFSLKTINIIPNNKTNLKILKSNYQIITKENISTTKDKLENSHSNTNNISYKDKMNNENNGTLNYVEFLKNLINSSITPEEEGYSSSIPHLDIYFLNNLNSYTESNFLEETISTKLSDKVFNPDINYVNKINDPKNNYKWKATVYSEFIGKSYSSMRNLLGNANFMKNLIQTNENKLNPQFIELDVNTNMQKGNFDNKEELPNIFSWQNVDGTNYDSPIKKQGECGSCYALAMLSVFETRLRIKSNNRQKPILSSSSVIGCSRTNQGCAGGYPYLVGKHGLEFGFVEESCQPYQEDDKTCKSLCYEEKVYKAKSYGYVGGYYGGCTEEKMMEEIYKNGPIVVAINATPELYYYKTGIFHSETIKKEGAEEKGVKPWEYTNHAVVAVGWGEEYIKEKLEKFWILKNSWGDSWGEKGYFRITRGVNMASVEAQGAFVIPE